MSCLTEFVRRVRAVCFFLLVMIIAIALVLVELPMFPIIYFMDPNRLIYHRLASMLARLCLLPFVSVTVKGREHLQAAQGTVLVANHQSVLDAFLFSILGLSLHFKVVIKREIIYYPGVGQIFMLAKHILVQRGNKSSGKQAMADSEDWINRNVSVLFFPEGTRKVKGVLGEFKKGAFYVAHNTGCAITPITIKGARSLMSPRGFPSMGWGNITLTVHKPVPTQGLEVEEVMNAVRQVILNDVQGEAPGLADAKKQN